MFGLTDSTAIDLDLPSPTGNDLVNPSFATTPSDVNHSFSVVEDSPQLTLPFHPHDTEADTGDRLESVKTDEIGGGITFDSANANDGGHRLGENEGYLPTETERFSDRPTDGVHYGIPRSEAHRPEEHSDYNQNYTIPGGTSKAFVAPHLDDSLDSVVAEGGRTAENQLAGRLAGSANEAYDYDGDAETDVSYIHQGSPVMEPPVRRNPDPFPVLER